MIRLFESPGAVRAFLQACDDLHAIASRRKWPVERQFNYDPRRDRETTPVNDPAPWLAKRVTCGSLDYLAREGAGAEAGDVCGLAVGI